MSDIVTSSTEVPMKKITLDTLPNELIFSIFSYLPAPSFVALHCTSRAFNTILKTRAESLWITLCHDHGGLSFEELHAIHARLYNVSYRNLFTRFFYRYGYLIGIWFGDQRPHGDLLVIEWDLKNISNSETPGSTSIGIKAFRICPLNTAAVPYGIFSQNPNIVVSNLSVDLIREPIFSITLSVLPPNQLITETEDNISIATICHEEDNYDLFSRHNVRITRSTFRPHPKTGLWDQNREHNLFVDYYPMGLVDNELFLDDDYSDTLDNQNNPAEHGERAALREMVVDWAFNDTPMTAIATSAGVSSSSSSSSTHGTHWSTSLLVDRTPSFSLICERKPSDFCTNYARLPDQAIRPSHPTTFSASSSNNHSLNGIWAGDYSSHGVEILFLHTLCTTTSPNTVMALKLTGDSNVPRSEITWAAYMDERAVIRTCNEPEFNGKVAYRGWGQIAGLGFGGASFIDVEVIFISNDELVTHFIRLQVFQRYHRLKL